MDGIGEKLVDQLLHLELIQTIPDLYRLQQAELENIERMGEKSALNVLKELAKTKTLNLGRFLHAMGLSAQNSPLRWLKSSPHLRQSCSGPIKQ